MCGGVDYRIGSVGSWPRHCSGRIRIIRRGGRGGTNTRSNRRDSEMGKGQSTTAVQQTQELTRNLTREAVREMAEKGLTREAVEELLRRYQDALTRNQGPNTQLTPRIELMQRILDLW
jgi:hypothetical protein